MIVGELEEFVAQEYLEPHDEFWGKKNREKRQQRRADRRARREKTPEEIEERKAKRKSFFSGLGNQIKEGGGSLGNLMNLFTPQQNADPTNFQVEIGDTTQDNNAPDEGQGIPKVYWVVGGLVVLGVVGYFGYQRLNNKEE